MSIDGRCTHCGKMETTAGCPDPGCPGKLPLPSVTRKEYVLSLMELLTDEERMEIMGQFCPEHGRKNCPCDYIGH